MPRRRCCPPLVAVPRARLRRQARRSVRRRRRSTDTAIADDVTIHADEYTRAGNRPVAGTTLDLSRRRCRFCWRIGTRISVTISPGRAAVSYGPRWNSRAGTVRCPSLDAARSLPTNADITADRSSDGSAWHNDPPTVPRLRTIGSAITRSASREDRVVLVGHCRLEQLAVPGHCADWISSPSIRT